MSPFFLFFSFQHCHTKSFITKPNWFTIWQCYLWQKWKYSQFSFLVTEFIVKLDNAGSATATNYTGGEGAGSSWTDKVMSFKGKQDVPQDEGDGAEDDEWVSIRLEGWSPSYFIMVCVFREDRCTNGDCWSIWKSGLKMKGLPGVN